MSSLAALLAKLPEADALAVARAIARAEGAPAEPAPSPAPAEPKYLSVAAYAKRVGYSEWKVREWVKDGLPHTNAPGTLRVIVADADRWIEQGPGARQGLRLVAGGKP